MRWGPRAMWAIVATVAAAGGCGGGGSGGDSGVRARFEVPRADAPPSEFYALPFPTDIRVGDDGAIDLADHPRHNDLVAAYVDIIAARQRGLSLTAPSFFRFDAEIDPATLPATPQAATEDGASVYLVNVDPDSPGRGERLPLRFRFEPVPGEVIGDNWLSAAPYPGF